MDRILFFTIAKSNKEISQHKVQIFRSQMELFVVYYFQLCGYPSCEEYPLVWGEMHKSYLRLQERFLKKEEQLHTYLAYDESFENWLIDVNGYAEWKNSWAYPLYPDYTNPANLKWILDRIPGDKRPLKVYVLGSGMGIQDWLPYVAGKVNKIEFYLEIATRGMEELQEILLEEYGMLTEVHLITGMEFSNLRLQSEEPVLVIDFSGRIPISVLGLKKGSIWVDMDSVEVKRHTMEDRKTGVQYYSLKTIWKREMLQTLDIISKFAYNTDVKIGKL